MEEVSSKRKMVFNIKDKYTVILISILVFAFIIRLYYFFQTQTQACWWDECEYLMQAKHWAFGFPNTAWFKGRPLFMPLIYAGLFKIGMGEVFFRFLSVVLSTLGVYLTYLIGKVMYNKKVGLIAAFILSVFYLHLFFTARLLMEVPSLTFALLVIYLFWKGYVKEKNTKLMLWMGLFLTIGILTRYTNGLIAIAMLIYLILTERLNFLKEKSLWYAGIVGLIAAIPFFIYSQKLYGSPLFPILFGAGSAAGISFSQGLSQFLFYITYFNNYLNTVLLIVLLIGLVYFANLFLGLDLVLRGKEKKLRADLFLFLWVMVILIYFGFFVNHTEPRYVIYIFVPAFFIIANALLKIYGFLEKYGKTIAMSAVLIILAIGAYQQLTFANELIDGNKDGFAQLRESGLWINENTKVGDVVYNSGVPQNTYYTERLTLGYPATPEDFEKEILERNPKYMVLSSFQPSPDWTYTYAQENTAVVTPVLTYFSDAEQTRPILIVYEFVEYS